MSFNVSHVYFESGDLPEMLKTLDLEPTGGVGTVSDFRLSVVRSGADGLFLCSESFLDVDDRRFAKLSRGGGVTLLTVCETASVSVCCRYESGHHEWTVSGSDEAEPPIWTERNLPAKVAAAVESDSGWPIYVRPVRVFERYSNGMSYDGPIFDRPAEELRAVSIGFLMKMRHRFTGE